MKNILLSLSLLFNLVFFGLVIRHYVLLPNKPTRRLMTHFTNRDKVLADLPKATSDILFLGDSQFQNFELEESFKSLTVKNRGICYDSSAGILDRVADATKGKPAKIFIEVGINDLENSVPLDSIVSNVEKSILAIKEKSPNTKVYLNSVLPTKQNIDDSRQSILPFILSLNNKYKLLAQKQKISFINMDSYFLDQGLAKKYDVGDGVHLNGAGYEVWRDVLESFVNK